MSFLGGAECSTAANPLSQFTKHVQDDKSLQRDRLVGTGPGGLQETFRSPRGGPPQDEVERPSQHSLPTKEERLIDLAGVATVSTAEWAATPRTTPALRHGADAAGSRRLPEKVPADRLTTLVGRLRSTRAGEDGGGLPESKVCWICTTWIQPYRVPTVPA